MGYTVLYGAKSAKPSSRSARASVVEAFCCASKRSPKPLLSNSWSLRGGRAAARVEGMSGFPRVLPFAHSGHTHVKK